MKAKYFMGEPTKAVDLFNKFMKDRTLTNQVIIQTVSFQVDWVSGKRELCIVVYHPNYWDEPKEEPK